MFADGRPIAATIQLDDDADGSGWFFDPTPQDDVEFTAIANSGASGSGTSFQGSFVDVTQAGVFDFYNTILHEIGHAVGIALHPQSRLSTLTGPAFAFDAVNPAYVLRQFNGPTTSATLTTAGGTHIYEGTAANPVHPNELMNSGRTNDFSNLAVKPTLRRQISDLTVNIVKDAFGYGVNLPSEFDTAHVTLDSQTGTLLVQGRAGLLNDTINIDTVGSDIRVVVNGATERVPAAQVSRIIIAKNGGNDTQTVTGMSVPWTNVAYVVSSNQDSASAGTPGDGIVDIDPVIPGNQVPVRAAVVDANDGTLARAIYVPRGTYKLTLTGSVDDTQGDLDISQNITIIGTGAGESIIDASGLGATFDRVFEIAGTSGSPKTLTLDSLTVTGGKAPNLPGTP